MEALKLPSLKLPDLPRPTRWDFYAIGALLVGLVLAAATVKMPRLAMTLMLVQLVVSCGGLLLLGKTAKEGTWWGNLAAIGAMMIGMGGVLLAAAIWATA
ncbi:MAG: hypothetical protein ACJ76J_17520 [Thermoanaerobaculia bacterium]